ncbi:MAG: alkaline phosphatase [Bacteroidales bacterium]|jgi:alkaline phosphatase|nr:alkaline phosphatase [Bacteroidales bacterium]
MKKYISLVLLSCLFSGILSAQQQVKNVIIMIGDGMGVTQVYAGLTANHGSLNLERAVATGFSKTYSASHYITESAAGGTAIACGQKTKNDHIGVDVNGDSIPSMLDIAHLKGLATGIVVTCELTHATPAAFSAHQKSRSMANEIAGDISRSGIDVLIGGGRKYFENRKDGINLSEKMRKDGYAVGYSLSDTAKVEQGKILLLLDSVALPAYPARGEILPNGVSAALNILSKNSDGFILMVEGSQIDWGGHDNNINKVINEMLDFDRAVARAFDFADRNPGTLVVITADHETGGLALTDGDFEKGTVAAHFASKNHTSVMVPVFAYGACAENFTGIFQNTDIFGKICSLLQMK